MRRGRDAAVTKTLLHRGLRLRAERESVSHGIVLGVTHREAHFGDAEPARSGSAIAMQDDKRLAAGLAPDLDIEPAKLCAYAGPEGFGDGFLGGKARSVKGLRTLHGAAILTLFGGEDAGEKAFAMAPDGFREARGFNDIDAGAEDRHAAPRIRLSISATAWLRPTMTALWPASGS